MIESELLHYSYLFVLLGTVLEGDATLLTAAFLAHRGYLRLSGVLAAAALSTFAANQVYFALARKKGRVWFEAKISATPRFRRIAGWMSRRGILLLLASRFLIGFRTIVPIMCGASGMKPGRFLIWNATGAAMWAGIFGAAGYLGGQLLTILFADIRRHEKAVAVGTALSISAFVLWRTHGREWLDVWMLRRSAGNG